MILYKNFKNFIVHIAALKISKMTIYPSKAIQIIGDNFVQITAL